MADQKVEGEALKKLVKLGRRKQLAFAFNPGPKNDHFMMIDKRKKPEVIAKIAKKEGAGTKVAFGTFEVKSKDMELTCERTVPAMAKVLKKYLKSQKVMVNIIIKDAGGTVVDSDVEELPDEPGWDEDTPETIAGQPEDTPQQQAAAPEPEEEPSGPEIDPAELVARIKALQPAMAGAAGGIAAKLKKVATAAVGQIKEQQLDAAEKTVAALEAAVARLSPAEKGQDQPRQDSAPEQGPSVKDLVGMAGALKEQISGVSGPAQDKLMSALGNAAKQIKSGDLPAAEGLLNKIGNVLNKTLETAQDVAEDVTDAVQDTLETVQEFTEEVVEDIAETAQDALETAQEELSEEARKWQMVVDRLQPEIDKLISERRGDLDAINRFFNYAKEQAEEQVFDKAMAAAQRVVALIREAADMTTTATADEARKSAPDNVAAYTRSRLGWIDVRTNLKGEISALKSAIDSATAGIEGLEDMPSQTGALFDHISGLDNDLEQTLEALVEKPDGEDREKLKSEARDIIARYRGVLDTDFFKDVGNNGFTSTTIRRDALASLNEVSAALQA